MAIETNEKKLWRMELRFYDHSMNRKEATRIYTEISNMWEKKIIRYTSPEHGSAESLYHHQNSTLIVRASFSTEGLPSVLTVSGSSENPDNLEQIAQELKAKFPELKPVPVAAL